MPHAAWRMLTTPQNYSWHRNAQDLYHSVTSLNIQQSQCLRKRSLSQSLLLAIGESIPIQDACIVAVSAYQKLQVLLVQHMHYLVNGGGRSA